MSFYSSISIDLSSWLKTLIQVEEYILRVAQISHWPVKCMFVGNSILHNKHVQWVEAGWKPCVTKVVSLITLAKIRIGIHTTFPNWMIPNVEKTVHWWYINYKPFLFQEPSPEIKCSLILPNVALFWKDLYNPLLNCISFLKRGIYVYFFTNVSKHLELEHNLINSSLIYSLSECM